MCIVKNISDRFSVFQFLHVLLGNLESDDFKPKMAI